MKKTFLRAATIALLSLAAVSANATDFGVLTSSLSTASFTSDALLESITGTSSAVTGSITTDMNDASKTSGTITFPVSSLTTGIDMRDEHMHGEQWLDAAHHAEITFVIKSVNVTGSNRRFTHGAAVEGQATGDLTIHGVTKSVTIPVKATYYEITNPQVAGTAYLDGNVLRVETTFKVKLTDYGINVPEPLRNKLASEVTLNVKVTAKQK